MAVSYREDAIMTAMTIVLGIILLVAAAFAWRVYQVVRDERAKD